MNNILKAKENNEIIESLEKGNLSLNVFFLKSVINNFKEGIDYVFHYYPNTIEENLQRSLTRAILSVGDLELVKYLLSFDKESDSIYEVDYNELILKAVTADNFEILDFLIELKDSFNVLGSEYKSYKVLNFTDEHNMESPLSLAISSENSTMIEHLLNKGADPNFANCLAFQQACIQNNVEVVSYFFKNYNMNLSGFSNDLVDKLLERRSFETASYLKGYLKI